MSMGARTGSLSRLAISETERRRQGADVVAFAENSRISHPRVWSMC